MTKINEQKVNSDFAMNFGPAHPGSGNFAIKVEMRGERVLKATADPGYLHRGFEKMMEYIRNGYVANGEHQTAGY